MIFAVDQKIFHRPLQDRMNRPILCSRRKVRRAEIIFLPAETVFKILKQLR
jgi:hypothetical protein